jgi:outer membrane protein TolC
MRSRAGLCVIVLLMIALLSGCTVHPAGERAQRSASLRAGKPFEKPPQRRSIPPLPENPAPDDLVRYALLSSAMLEQRYWEWRAAIEQIPQDGTPQTTLAINAATAITRGRSDLADTTLTAQNMPSMMIPWPGKLSAAARHALEEARAAGHRFEQEKFDLRKRVLDAWWDYALTAELIRLHRGDVQLLQTTITMLEARSSAGTADQSKLLEAQNQLALLQNQIANMESQLPAERAAINALLSRGARSPLPVPARLPATRPVRRTDGQLVELAAAQNPELAALASKIHGDRDIIRLAHLQYMPDFAVGAGSDLAGITQSLFAMVSAPVLRYPALNAAIAQAEARLKSDEALRRQFRDDLDARLMTDLAELRDADRQLELFQKTILPRARQIIEVSRSAYESGQTGLLELLENQRSVNDLERLVANLRRTRERALTDLEAITACKL